MLLALYFIFIKIHTKPNDISEGLKQYRIYHALMKMWFSPTYWQILLFIDYFGYFSTK